MHFLEGLCDVIKGDWFQQVGYSVLSQEMQRYGIPLEVLQSDKLPALLEHYSMVSLDKMCGRIGEGRLRLRDVIENIKDILCDGVSLLIAPTGEFNKIELTTLDPVSVKLSSCCRPNPTAKDNCALLTEKGLSVHHKKCSRFLGLNFQREDAVNILWRTRETLVRKTQILHILRATRKEIMDVIAGAPNEMEMQNLVVLSSYSQLQPAWELTFKVSNLYNLQKVIRHFERSEVAFEFYLEC